MKPLKITLMILLALICAWLLLGMVMYATGQWSPLPDTRTLFESTYPVDKVNALDVDWRDGRVTVERGGETITVRETARRNQPADQIIQPVIEDGTLKIVQRLSRGIRIIVIYDIWDTHLTVTLPDKLYERLFIKGSSGDFVLSDVKADTMEVHFTSGSGKLNRIETTGLLDVQVTSGSLKADRLTGSDLKASCTSGSIRISQADFERAEVRNRSGGIRLTDARLGEAALSCTSGSIRSERLTAEKVDAETSSGSVHLDGTMTSVFAKATSGGVRLNGTMTTVSAKTTSGSVRLIGAMTDVTAQATSGGIHVDSDVRPDRINASCHSGSIKVLIPDDPAGFTLKYKVGSGSMRTDFPLDGFHRDNHTGTHTYGEGQGAYDFSVTSGGIRLTQK